MILETTVTTPGTERLAYSVSEFSRVFSVGRSTVFAEIAAGRLRARKIGTRTVIAHEDAMAWLRSLPARAAPQR